MTVYIRDAMGAFNCQDVRNFSVCGNEVNPPAEEWRK